MSTSYVYFVQAGDAGPIKIGCSTQPLGDIHEIQQNVPIPLRVLMVTEGDRALWAKLHRVFEPQRVEAGWFEPSNALYAVMQQFVDLARDLDVPAEIRAPLQRPTLSRADMTEVKRSWDAASMPHLYIVRVPEGPIWIGSAWEVERHIANLQAFSPSELEIVTVLECAPSIVEEIRAEMEPHRIHGQWYHPHIDVQLEVDLVAERVRTGMGVARFYGGREIRVLDRDTMDDQMRWLSEDLDATYRRANAPYASVVHLKSGAVIPRRHMTVVEAQDVLRDVVAEEREHLEAICLFQRSLGERGPDTGLWTWKWSTGSCLGGCAKAL